MSRHALVLAIEPDLRQAAIVKRVVKERVQADVVVVDSRDAAIAAIRTAIPDVLLVSTLLSPRDEDDLIAHLRTLEGAAHLQTHTIPQLASALGHGEDGGGGGLFSAFRRKKASAPAGCDPDMFADEIRVYVERAAQKKREAAEGGGVTPIPSLAARPAEKPATVSEEAPEAAPGSSWSSPFEWRPSNRSSFVAPPEPAAPEPPLPEPITFAPEPEPEPEPAYMAPLVDPPIRDSGIKDKGLRIHTPAPFSVWARKEVKPSEAPSTGELNAFFAKLGVPDSVASVGYPEGVRIRRVRVRVAKESHPSLQGAMLLGRRMLAELRGTDATA